MVPAICLSIWGIFSVIIIKSKYRLLLALSLGVTMVISVLLVACNNVNAQTLESLTRQRKLFEIPQMKVGRAPVDIKINEETNKIYVVNDRSGSVSVIDSNSGTSKDIRVGVRPVWIAINGDGDKIYVANPGSNTVSVIDGYNDSKIKDIPVGVPSSIAIGRHMIYVASGDTGTVSVINGTPTSSDG
jgi:YVTN family beta-propeller protein